MSWVTLSLTSAFLWAIGNIIDKIILSRWAILPILPVLVIGIVDLIVSSSIFIFYDIPLLPIPLMLLALTAGACYFLMLYFYFYAMKWEEASRVIPLLYLTPLWIAIIAHFFLGETLKIPQYMGIALLVTGSILISINSLKTPHLNKALLAIIFSCFCFALNQTLTKYLLEEVDVLSTFAYIRAGAFLSMLPLLLINIKKLIEIRKNNGILPIALMTGNAGLNLLALFIFVSAANIGYITLVNALVAVQPFFVLLFVTWFTHFYPLILQEKLAGTLLLKKIIAIALMFSGAVLIQ